MSASSPRRGVPWLSWKYLHRTLTQSSPADNRLILDGGTNRLHNSFTTTDADADAAFRHFRDSLSVRHSLHFSKELSHSAQLTCTRSTALSSPSHSVDDNHQLITMWPGCRPLRPNLAFLHSRKFTRSRFIGAFDQTRLLYQTRRRPQNAAAAAVAQPQSEPAPREQVNVKENEAVKSIPYSELTIGVPLEGKFNFFVGTATSIERC